MIKEIVIKRYEVDGKMFGTKEEAKQYERQLNKCERPKPKYKVGDKVWLYDDVDEDRMIRDIIVANVFNDTYKIWQYFTDNGYGKDENEMFSTIDELAEYLKSNAYDYTKLAKYN